jgi:hypothetical protein
MTEEYRVKIYFEDECPRIGSGWRTVTVREGRKWAYLTDCAGRRARVTLKLLDELLPVEKEAA